MSRWFIDTIDPRAGLAFAALRDPDLLTDRIDDGLSAFISPPYFTPEIVDGRGLGFGLARARGQIGVFVKDDEVPFDSLEAVAEFVRRVYLRGSGGDGPGEDGAPPLPPLPPLPEGGSERGGPPDLGPKHRNGEDEPRDFGPKRRGDKGEPPEFGSKHKGDEGEPPDLERQQTGGEGEPPRLGRQQTGGEGGARGPGRQQTGGESEPPDLGPGPAGGASDPVDALIRLGKSQRKQSEQTPFGASQTAETLAAGAPTSEAPVDRLVRAAVRLLIETLRRRPAAFPHEAAIDWLQTVDHLTRVIARLGLLPLVAHAVARNMPLRTWVAQAMPPPHGFDWILRSHPYPDPILLGACSQDPYGDLARLPVPDHLAATAGPHQGSPTLRSVLQTVLATPAERLAWGVPVVGEARAELAFFAACYLNVGPARQPLFWSENYCREFVREVCRRGRAWMRRNLPERVFSPPVEALITRADQVPA